MSVATMIVCYQSHHTQMQTTVIISGLLRVEASFNTGFLFTVCVYVDSTPRQLVAREELLVLPRRRTRV